MNMKSLVSALALLSFVGAVTVPAVAHADTTKKAAKHKSHKGHKKAKKAS
jgi:hypothetical protein